MYADIQREFGVNAPVALRAVDPDRVADAVVQAITGDRPDMLVTGWPMRPLLAIQELAPRVAERLIVATGAPRFFRTVAELAGRGLVIGNPESADRNAGAVRPERASRVAQRQRLVWAFVASPCRTTGTIQGRALWPARISVAWWRCRGRARSIRRGRSPRSVLFG